MLRYVIWLLLLPWVALAQPSPTNCQTPSARCRSSRFTLVQSPGTLFDTNVVGSSVRININGSANSNASINMRTVAGGVGVHLQGNGETGITLAQDFVGTTSTISTTGLFTTRGEVPQTTDLYDLGSSALRWQEVLTSRSYFNLGQSIDVAAANLDPNGGGAVAYDTTRLLWRQCTYQGCVPIGSNPHPALERRPSWTFWPNESTTTTNAGWSTNPTIVDAAAATTNTNDSTRYFRNFVTTAAVGGTSSIRADDSTRPNYKPSFTVNVRTHETLVTSTRIWAGLSDRTVAQMNADDPASANLCAFRYSTDAGDANWTLCTKDGATLSCTSTGIPVTAATTYTLRIEVEPTGCYGFVGSGTNLTFPAYRDRRLVNLPGVATNLLALTMIEARAASARSLGVNNFTLETR